ncbi:MAG: GNAT family N-acetyltransferase [Acetatifactor sp.]|nr:GNAT family N-acetyltransferase [Acetatifactor sp.]
MTDDQKVIENKSHEIHELLKKAYWAKDRSESATQKAISNSLKYAIFESNSERLVGFARVITDYSTVYYLSDVYIDEEFRGRGLGKKIVEWIVLHEDKLLGINGLLKTRDAMDLYKKYGFEECKVVCMVR